MTPREKMVDLRKLRGLPETKKFIRWLVRGESPKVPKPECDMLKSIILCKKIAKEFEEEIKVMRKEDPENKEPFTIWDYDLFSRGYRRCLQTMEAKK